MKGGPGTAGASEVCVTRSLCVGWGGGSCGCFHARKTGGAFVGQEEPIQPIKGSPGTAGATSVVSWPFCVEECSGFHARKTGGAFVGLEGFIWPTLSQRWSRHCWGNCMRVVESSLVWVWYVWVCGLWMST
jgi:hypothetical protein